MTDDIQTKCNGPSYKGTSVIEIYRHVLERCGKPATTPTLYGWRCAECAARLERGIRDESSVMGMLVARQKRKEST